MWMATVCKTSDRQTSVRNREKEKYTRAPTYTYSICLCNSYLSGERGTLRDEGVISCSLSELFLQREKGDKRAGNVISERNDSIFPPYISLTSTLFRFSILSNLLQTVATFGIGHSYCINLASESPYVTSVLLHQKQGRERERMSKDSLLIVFCRSAESFAVSLDAFILPVPNNNETPSFFFLSLSLSFSFFSTRAGGLSRRSRRKKRKKIFLLLYATWLFSSVCLSHFLLSPFPSSMMKKEPFALT